MTETRRYEFESSKFWEVTVEGATTKISYGAMGAKPRLSNKEHKDAAAALKFAEQKVKEKLKKGYVLVMMSDMMKKKKRELEETQVVVPPANKRVKKNDSMASDESTVATTSSGTTTNESTTNNSDAESNKTCTAVRRFEFGTPATKFWEVRVEGTQTLITYGPMGGQGRPSNVDHKDVATANKFAEKKVREKLQKGYVEVITTEQKESWPNKGTAGKGTGPLADGEGREVQGSAANPYIVSRRGEVYSCTCPGWRFQKNNIAQRSCKHLKETQGDEAETARVGSVASSTTSGKISTSALPFPSVMLANKYEPDKHESSLSSGDWWMSEKLDGLRAIWDGSKFLSRAGNVFYAPKEFVQDFPKDMVLDGELFCGRGNFDQASGLVRSMGASYDQWKSAVSYEIFDIPLLKTPFEERLKEIERVTQNMKHGNAVAHELVESVEHFSERLASVEADDGEGLMLRKKGSSYEFRRSNSLLKVKMMHDAEAEVVGHEGGKGKHSGKVGALVCQLPSGKQFKVGTGFTDKERANPPPVGSTITFGYYEMTKGGVPRFPAFKRIFEGY